MTGEQSSPAARDDAGAPSLSVRPVAPADVPRVFELLGELAGHEQLADRVTGSAELLHEALFGRGDRLCGLVAERADRVVGYALYYPVFSSYRGRWRLWLEDLCVERAARGSGAGGALMSELARRALAGGYFALEWDVLEGNRSARDFYARLGARVIGEDWLRQRLDGDALERAAARE